MALCREATVVTTAPSVPDSDETRGFLEGGSISLMLDWWFGLAWVDGFRGLEGGRDVWAIMGGLDNILCRRM
jgi:hypothetical protein